MNQKILNINYKINIFKWALSQPIAYPLLIVLTCVFMTLGLALSKYVLACVIMLLIASIFIMFGVEQDGVFIFDKVKNRLIFICKKATKAKGFEQVRTIDNVLVANNNIYSKLQIDNINSDDEQLFRTLINGVDDTLIYSVETNINHLLINDIQDYLRSDLDLVDTNLLSTCNLFIADIEKIVEDNQFNTVQNTLTLIVKNIDSEIEEKKIKQITNQKNQLIKQTNNNICLF